MTTLKGTEDPISYISQDTLGVVQCLQDNDNEELNAHIHQLGNVCLFLGRQLNGFDPQNPDDLKTVESIAALSNTAAMLNKLSRP